MAGKPVTCTAARAFAERVVLERVERLLELQVGGHVVQGDYLDPIEQDPHLLDLVAVARREDRSHS